MATPINDEWETIAAPEDEWETIEEPSRGRIAEAGAALGRGFLGLGKAALGATQRFSPIYGKVSVPYALGLTKPVEMLEEAKGKIATAREKIPRTREGIEGWAINVIGEGAPYLAATIGTGGTALGLAGPAMIGFAMGGESAYEKAKAGGASEKQALFEYGLGGVAEAALEMWGVSQLLKFKSAGKGSLKALVGNVKKKLYKQAAGNLKNIGSNALKSALVEGLEESSQQGASIAIPGMLRGDVPKTSEGKTDWWAILTEVGEAGAGGALLGAVVPGGMNVPAGVGEAARPTMARIEKAAQTIQDSAMGDIEKARMINELKELPTVEEEGAGPAFDLPGSTQQVVKKANRLANEMGEAVADAAKPEAKKARKKRKGKMWSQVARILKTEGIGPVEKTKMARAAMKGYLRDRIPQIAEKFNQDDVADLHNAVHEATTLGPADKQTVLDTFYDVFVNKVMPHPSRIKAFDKFFGTDIWGQTKKYQTKGQKAWRVAGDIWNTPKAVWASVDQSFFLRQGWAFTMRHPIRSAPALARAYRTMASKEYHKLREIERKTDPRYNEAVQNGMAVTEAGGSTKSEEAFESELAHQLPVYGPLIQASDRGFTTAAGEIRLIANKYYYEKIEGSNSDPDIVQAKKEEMTEVVNHMTGRGGPKRGTPIGEWYNKYQKVFSIPFWTPKLLMSRVQTVADLYTKPHVRKLIAGELVGALGAGAMALGLLKLWFRDKMEVELNPISSDSGKGKVGNTRFDFWGGYQQLMRYTAQITSGKKKAIATGEIYDVEQFEVFKQFLRSKVSPPIGMGWDVATGETFLGKKMTTEPDFMAEYTLEHIVPLFLQDVADAVRFQGMDTASWVAPLAVHGVGANTYEERAFQKELQIKNSYAHEVYGVDWNELGADAQDLLRIDKPYIVQAEEKTAEEDTNWDRVAKRMEAQDLVGKKVQKSLSKSVRKELDRLNVEVPGFSRLLDTDWYLNQKRYKEYQEITKKMLEKEISSVIFRPAWKQLDRRDQKDMLEELVADVKSFARQQVVDEANFADYERAQ